MTGERYRFFLEVRELSVTTKNTTFDNRNSKMTT